MESKKKLLLLNSLIPHYRVPVYNALGKHYDLTVAHYGDEIDTKGLTFSQIRFNTIKNLPFYWFKENVYKLAQNYDAVLSMAQLRTIPYMTLAFGRRNFSLTYWSIGVTASYKKKFDEDKRYDWLRYKWTGRADSLAFYSSYPIKKHLTYGIPREKMFVAENTIEINDKIEIISPKDYFLFVGTLYKEKKIFDLLESYYNASMKNSQFPKLVIVGDGIERDNIIKWLDDRGMSSKVVLKGAIFDSTVLMDIFRKAIACISPGQAGLSVLTSMAYGVPFVTTKDAITGGEIFNIEEGQNGLYYDGTINGLTETMIYLSEKPKEVYRIAKNGQDFYFENRTIEVMVDGLIQDVEYALKNKKKK